MKIYDIIVVGAGPAGLMAGITAAKAGNSVLILEHMKEAGRKLLICGKGRCNVTNDCEIRQLLENIPTNGKFLHSAIRAFDNQQLRGFFLENGIETKVERGGRVFPVSDKSVDVRDTLLKIFATNKGEIKLNTAVQEIVVDEGKIAGVKTKDKQVFKAKNVIVAAGGASYPKTGSDGSGFTLAKMCGHEIVQLKPSLVPLESSFHHLPQLQGLSLRNVTAKVVVNNKVLQTEFGEMLFAHFGLTGPIILTLSNLVSNHLNKNNVVEISIDLKPALTPEVLDVRIQRDFVKFNRKQIKNSLNELLPSSLIPVMLDLSGIDPDHLVSQITKVQRRNFLNCLKDFRIMITKTRPLSEAIVTSGGVNVKEVSPKTMESKLVSGLFFAGEVLDVDGYTGGFNLQAAFSTGYVAGTHAVNNC